MGVYDNSDGRAESLNSAAAHDASLYDPNRHDNQIVALYESRAALDMARDALLAAGIPRSAIEVIDRTERTEQPPSNAEDRNHGGFWGALKSLFAPSDDLSDYHTAVDRGHAMLVLTPTADMDRHRAIQVLEETHPVDFDAKLEEWRQAGYDQLPNAGTGAAAEQARIGRREPAQRGTRVRSYVVDRSADAQTRLHEETGQGLGTGGAVTNATPGATSSGTNAPRT